MTDKPKKEFLKIVKKYEAKHGPCSSPQETMIAEFFYAEFYAEIERLNKAIGYARAELSDISASVDTSDAVVKRLQKLMAEEADD